MSNRSFVIYNLTYGRTAVNRKYRELPTISTYISAPYDAGDEYVSLRISVEAVHFR